MSDFIRDNLSLPDDKIDAAGGSSAVANPTRRWSPNDATRVLQALRSIQLYLRTGTLDVPSPTTLAGLHVTASASPSVGPETDHIGFRGRWFEGVDVANAPTSRDYVERGLRLDYSISDGATTSGSPTLTSAADGNFTTSLVGAGISGNGIPVGTTVTAVGGLTSLTMSTNATATATGVRVTLTTGASQDLLYWKHRGSLSPTLGVGVTPPDGTARLQVSAQDNEPAMGTVRVRVGGAQTGKAFTIHDSTPVDRLWVDNGFYLSGNNPTTASAVAIQAETSANGRAIAIASNDKATVYGLSMPTGSGGVMRVACLSGGNSVMDLGTDGSLRHLSTKLGFFGGSVATKPTVTGSRGGNAALASLLTALAGLGLITDSTTA